MKRQSDKWAILIGVNRYHESLGPLKYAVNDCRRVGEVLTQGEDGFPADHVLVVADDQPEDRRPTYANIHSWLASWLSQPKDNDTVFVYFSGHGRDMAGKCYLAPGDATLQTMHVTGIPVAHVQDILSRCKAKQKILVLDACHSGAGKDVAAMSGSMMDQIAAGKGIYTITACDADELSHEWDEKKQGVFSYYLAEALSGACPADAQGRVTAESLYEWVYDRVRFWAAKKRCTQTPKRFAEGTGVLTLRTSFVLEPTPFLAPSATTDLGEQVPATAQWDSLKLAWGDIVAIASVRYRPTGVKSHRVCPGKVVAWDPHKQVGVIDCGKCWPYAAFGLSDLDASGKSEWCHAGAFVSCEVADVLSGVRASRIHPHVTKHSPSTRLVRVWRVPQIMRGYYSSLPVWMAWARYHFFNASAIHLDWTRRAFFDALGHALEAEEQMSVRVETVFRVQGAKKSECRQSVAFALEDSVVAELQLRGLFVGQLPHGQDYVLHFDVTDVDKLNRWDYGNPTTRCTLTSSVGSPVWCGHHKFKGVKLL